MTIKEISVGELLGFLESELYRESDVKPITAERVHSQINNPRALPDDIVLIVAYSGDGKLAGFIGMLPDTGNSNEEFYRFAWNSCWWVDRKAEQGIALKLFYRSIQVWQGNYMITDLTQHTRKIVELTRLFNIVNPIQGYGLQIRSDFTGKLTRRKKLFRFFLPVSLIADKAVNLIMGWRLKKWDRKNTPAALQIEYLERPDAACLDYIEKHNERELCRRGEKEFDWIISYPWLVNDVSGKPSVNYPFSHACKNLELYITKILYQGKMAGIALLSIREGLFKIPYAYTGHSVAALFSCAICKIMVDKKAMAFHSFRQEINDYIEKSGFPVFYKKKVAKGLAVSKTLAGRQPEKYYLQDGDGDVVFT
jgi:hypothetical protein